MERTMMITIVYWCIYCGKDDHCSVLVMHGSRGQSWKGWVCACSHRQSKTQTASVIRDKSGIIWCHSHAFLEGWLGPWLAPHFTENFQGILALALNTPSGPLPIQPDDESHTPTPFSNSWICPCWCIYTVAMIITVHSVLVCTLTSRARLWNRLFLLIKQ